MKLKIKKAFVIGFCAVLVGGLTVYGMARPKAIPVVAAQSKDIRLYFTEEGFVKDENIINVFSLHSGAVVSLFVEENQLINQGDIICEIDSSRLRHELEEAKNTIRGYESQISDLDLRELQKRDELTVSRNRLLGDYESVSAEERNASEALLNAVVTKDEQFRLQEMIIEQNRTDLQTARDDLQRYEILYEGGALPKTELDAHKAAADRLESALEQNRQQLEVIRNSNETLSKEAYYQSMKNSIQAQISGIDNQLRNSYGMAMKDYYQSLIESVGARIRLLEKQIEECSVKAPATGMITKLHIDKSNIAGSDSPVAIISTGFDNLVEVYVPTTEIGKVHVDDIVDLELKSASGTVYHGIVIDIEDRAVVTTSSLGIEKRKVKVTIQPLPEHAEHFKSGYDLSASFTTYRGDSKLTVPRTSVVKTDGNAAVWVITADKAELRVIEIEQELKVEYVVSSGLAEGELVVKDATTPGLAEGARFAGAL